MGAFFQYEAPIKNYTNSAIRKIRNKNRKLRLNEFFGFFSDKWRIYDSQRGAPTPEADAPIYYFAIFLAENCMKMKEFGPGGASMASCRRNHNIS